MAKSPLAKYDVLCAGIITIDFVCAPLKRLPQAGLLEMTDRIELAIGGCASNVAVDLARVGRRACIAGRVGDDVLGRYVCEQLTAEGADCGQVTFSRSEATASTMVINVQGEDRRFIHDAGANAEFTGNEISPDVIRQCRAIYVGGFGLNSGLSGENVARLFAIARESNVLTVLDVVCGTEDVASMLTPVLPLTDLFLPNEDEARVITGIEDPVGQARRFREQGVTCVVITRGSHGAILHDGTRCMAIPAHHVTQVDATGGGDAFVAGYLHACLDGRGPEECLAYGAALGASCVQAAGATKGVLRAAALESYVRDHPLTVTNVMLCNES